MLKNRQYYAMTELADFQNYAHPDLTHQESGDLTVGHYKWNSDTQAVEVFNGANSGGGYFTVPLGKLYSGDVINLEAEFRWLATNAGRLAIDRYYNSDYSGTKQQVYQTSGDRPDSSEFILKTLSYVLRQDGYYKVSFGTWTNNVSRYELRKAKVLVLTDKA